MPYITRNENTTYAHEKSHEQVDFVVVKYAKAILNMTTRIVTLLVRRRSRTSNRYLTKSALLLQTFRGTYFLPTSSLYHFTSPRVNDTCLK